jgi:predicted DNA-binding transcriptional regulator AlpA
MSLVGLQVDELLNPLLITAADLARLLQVSTRTLWRLLSKGELPEPVRFAGTVRWRLQEIKNWIADGC